MTGTPDPSHTKRCTVCGVDVSQKKRTRDSAGNYYCDPCYKKLAISRVRAATGEPPSQVGTPEPPPDARPKRRRGRSKPSLIGKFISRTVAVVTIGGGLVAMTTMSRAKLVEDALTFGVVILLIGLVAGIVLLRGWLTETQVGGHQRLGQPGVQTTLKAVVLLGLLMGVGWLGWAGWRLLAAIMSSGADFAGIATGVINGVLALIALAVLSVPLRAECPRCHRWLAAALEDSQLLDRHAESETVEREERHYDANFKYAGRTVRQDQQLVTVETHLNIYRCRFCSHQWQKVAKSRT